MRITYTGGLGSKLHLIVRMNVITFSEEVLATVDDSQIGYFADVDLEFTVTGKKHSVSQNVQNLKKFTDFSLTLKKNNMPNNYRPVKKLSCDRTD